MAEIDNNVMLCDNPISLDEIEKGLWLGESRNGFLQTESLYTPPFRRSVRSTFIIFSIRFIDWHNYLF